MAKATKATKAEAKVDVNDELQAQLEAMQKQMAELQKQLASKDKELEKAEKDKVEAKKQVKQIDRNQRVAVRSVTEGGLTYVSRATGLTTTWSSFGDEHWIDVEELIRMKSSQPAFLANPWVVIDDESIVEYLGLKETYEKIIPVDELELFFRKSPEEIQAVLKKAPKGTKTLVASKARKLVQSKELDSISVIDAIEKSLEIDLSMVRD
jgi:hypothetical protein